MWSLFTCIVGYSRKNPKNEDMEFPGVLKRIWKFQRSSKKECNFHLIKKQSCGISHGSWFLVLEFPSVVVHTILWNFLRWSFVFSRISKDKVTNLKIPGFFGKRILQPPVWIFYWNSPIILAKVWATRTQKESTHFRGWVQVEYQCLMGRATSRRQFIFLATSVYIYNIICKH